MFESEAREGECLFGSSTGYLDERLEFTGALDASQFADDLFVLVEEPGELVAPVTDFVLIPSPKIETKTNIINGSRHYPLTSRNNEWFSGQQRSRKIRSADVIALHFLRDITYGRFVYTYYRKAQH